MTNALTITTRRVAAATGLSIAATLGSWSAAAADVTIAAVGASFDPATGVLLVRGDNLANAVTVGRNATGTILVNGGAVPIAGGVPTFSTTDEIRINGFGGDDTLSIDRLGGVMPPAILIGGAGNDRLTGGFGDDQFNAGAGNDTVDGGNGDDAAALGNGDDTFVWVPGDDNDLVEGQGGIDVLRVTGSATDEFVELSANGGRLRVTRDLSAVELDVAGVEDVQFDAQEGADTVTVGDLTGTSVTGVDVDLERPGTNDPDGQADRVIVAGTADRDDLLAFGTGTSVVTTGLPANVIMANPDRTDQLTIRSGDGNDFVAATGISDTAKLRFEGGADIDTLTGGTGGLHPRR